MLHYSVFHTNNKLSARTPNFLLCTQERDLESAAAHPGAPDYGLLQNHAGQWYANFYNRGRQFQFCGVGALAIAHYLLNRNSHAEAQQSCLISSDDFRFEILNFYQSPAVRISADEAEPGTGNIPGFRESSLFKSAKLFSAPLSLAVLKNFTADSNFCDMLVEKGLSALLYCEDLTKECIYFRYFTSFNNKFEDQVTGSVFRYLPYLISRPHGRYTVLQLSETGAAMQAYFENQKVIYWGRTERC